MKRQVGNSIRMEWTILRNGQAEDFSLAQDIKIVAFIPNLSSDKIDVPISRINNVFHIDIEGSLLSIGKYTLHLTYKVPNPAFESGFEMVSTAVKDAFQILTLGRLEGSLEDDSNITSNVIYCLDGATFIPTLTESATEVIISWTNNRGLPNPDPVNIRGTDGKSAFEIWKEFIGQPTAIEQDFFDYLQEPAIAAADLATAVANLANSAASAANAAALAANDAADDANAAATSATSAASAANSAASSANTAASNANSAATAANTAAINAQNVADTYATTLANKIDKTAVKQVTGTSTIDLMSQKAVTDELNKAAVYNITNAIPLSVGQYYTSTTARAAVPVGVRKKGLILNYETSAGVWFSERFIGTDTAAWTTASNWIQIPDKVYVDTQISNTLNVISENWVGVIVDPNLSSSEPSPKSTVVAYRATELQRTGNLNYHKFGKSRIFNAFYPAIVNRSTKQIAWRLNKNNPSLKEDGTASTPDWSTQNICIVIPNLYRRIVLLDGNADGRYEIRYDIAPFDGASLFHAESYHSIGDASIDRTNTQLVSVISNDVRFRGGGNQSAWDAQHRSQLGTPLTDTSRPNFELYANNAGWQTMNIYDWTMFSELAMLYFANTNIQLDYTSVLTAEGYPQGGLGAGNTSWISKRWDGFCGYYPIDKVGEGFSSIGCNVGIKSKTINDYYKGLTTAVAANKLVATAHFAASAGWLSSYVGYTVRNVTTGLTATIVAKDSDDQLSLSADIFSATNQIFSIDGVSYTYNIPVFFGLEHLYGHLWKYVSGINYIVQAADAGGRSMAYVNPDWATRSAVNVDSYQYVGDIPRVDDYIKILFPGWNIAKSNTGGSSTTYMSDYGYHANLQASGQVVRALLVSGSAFHGASAGLRYADSYITPSYTSAGVGARLRAIKP